MSIACMFRHIERIRMTSEILHCLHAAVPVMPETRIGVNDKMHSTERAFHTTTFAIFDAEHDFALPLLSVCPRTSARIPE